MEVWADGERAFERALIHFDMTGLCSMCESVWANGSETGHIGMAYASINGLSLMAARDQSGALGRMKSC
jgi:hypothetical protein